MRARVRACVSACGAHATALRLARAHDAIRSLACRQKCCR